MKEKLRMLFDEKLWKFLLVGVLNTLVGNGLMFLLYNLAGFSYWPATGLSYALASVMSYFLNRYFTFKYQGSGWETALRFALNIAVCYGLAYGLAKPLDPISHDSPQISGALPRCLAQGSRSISNSTTKLHPKSTQVAAFFLAVIAPNSWQILRSGINVTSNRGSIPAPPSAFL